MANILISHAPEDAALATALQARLAESGHKVWLERDFAGRPGDALAPLETFDAVIVLWSETSVASDWQHGIPARALRLRRLVQVRADGLARERLPTAFHGRVSYGIGDHASILSAVTDFEIASMARRARRDVPDIGAAEGSRPVRVGAAEGSWPMGVGSGGIRREGVGAARQPSFEESLRRPQGVGAADSPIRRPSSDAPAVSGSAKALEVEAGRLVHKIPTRMWLGVQETVEVRLGRLTTETLTAGLAGRGELTSTDIPIVESMSISLVSGPGAFTIERQSETTQLVMSDLVKGTAFESEDYGRWVWLVTPRKTGAHQLFVRVSAALKDRHGVPTTTRLPDREFKVSVSVHKGRVTAAILKRAVPSLILASAGGLVAAITQDVWWPKLHALLRSMGWLS